MEKKRPTYPIHTRNNSNAATHQIDSNPLSLNDAHTRLKSSIDYNGNLEH